MSLFFVAPFLTLRSIMLLLQPHLFHTNTPPSFQPCCAAKSYNFTPYYFSLSLFFTLKHCLFCTLSPSLCTWLCPIAVLAKHRADENVLNNVICQHWQPRKLYYFCASIRAATEVRFLVTMHVLLRCILNSAHDQVRVQTYTIQHKLLLDVPSS